MKHRGFEVGKSIVSSMDKDACVYLIKAMTEDEGTVVVENLKISRDGKKRDAPPGEDETVVIDRDIVCRSYVVHFIKPDKLYPPEDRKPALHWDLNNNIYVGAIKGAVLAQFRNMSCESMVTMVQEPKCGVRANAFVSKKALTLIALTNNVTVVAADKYTPPPESTNAFPLGKCFVMANGTPVVAVAKPHLSWPQKAVGTGFARGSCSEPFLVPFWAVQETADISRANCELSFTEVSVTAYQGAPAFTIKVPAIVNKKDLQQGEELVLLKKQSTAVAPRPLKRPDADASRDDGVTGKRPRAGAPKGKAHATGKRTSR